MSRTSELQKLPGVVAAAVFSRKGYLEELAGALGEAEATRMTNLCADVTMNMELQGRLLGRLADQKGWDCRGWITFGPETAIITIGDSACMVEASKASLNQLIAAMTESAGG